MESKVVISWRPNERKEISTRTRTHSLCFHLLHSVINLLRMFIYDDSWTCCVNNDQKAKLFSWTRPFPLTLQSARLTWESTPRTNARSDRWLIRSESRLKAMISSNLLSVSWKSAFRGFHQHRKHTNHSLKRTVPASATRATAAATFTEQILKIRYTWQNCSACHYEAAPIWNQERAEVILDRRTKKNQKT